MKNFSTGRLGRLFFNVVTLESRGPGSAVIEQESRDPGLRHSSMTLCDERQGGFTLIELLVVVLIIGILSAIALPQYRVAVLKARYTQLITLAESLRRAQQVYYLSNGTHTLTFTDLGVDFPCTPSGMNCVGKDFSCALNDGTPGNDVDGKEIMSQCGLEGHGTYLVYRAYPTHRQERYCVAAPDSPAGNAVCKSLGGTPALPDASNRFYQLP